MFHLLAYRGTVADVANTALTAIVDDIITRSAVTGTFLLPEDMNLYGATAMSATINRARLASASLRQINQPLIRPLIASLRPNDNHEIAYYLDQPLRLKANEELSIEGTSDVGVGGEVMTALLWIGKALTPHPAGDPITCRITSTTAAVANTWTTLAITMDQALPPGFYAIVGSEGFGTTQQAHRWIIPNQMYRPGNLSLQAATTKGDSSFIRRRWGEWGRFQNNALPQPQVLCTAADAAHTFMLQLIKVG